VNAAALAARSLALLGPVGGPVAVHAPARLASALAARAVVADDGMVPAGAVIAFVGEAADADARVRALRAVHAALPVGAPLVVVDHNQPRDVARRVVATLRLALLRLPPSRARYPVAREVLAEGFAVARLELVAGERLQIVLARRR
jgi:hypothetical protein